MAKKADKIEAIIENPDADALKLVTDRIKMFEGYIKPILEQRKEWWRIYRGQLSKPQYDYQTNVAVPYSTATIETIVPRLTQNDTIFRYVGETQEDEKNAPNMSELANDQMRRAKLELKKIDILKECLAIGTTVVKIPWTKEKKTITKDKPILKIGGLNIGTLRKKIEKTTKDQPDIQHIPLDDFYFDPYGASVNDDNACDWVGHRKLVTKEYIKKHYPKNADLISEDGKGSMTDGTENITEVKKPKDEHKHFIELFEYWEDNRKIVVANRETVLEDVTNPFDEKKKPFIVLVDRPIPHQLLGMGEIEFMIGLQDLLNSFICQAFDTQKGANNKLVFIEKGSGLNKEKFVSQPFGVHSVDDLQKIKFVELPGVDPMTVQLVELLKTFMEHVSGVSDYSKGMNETDLNDTATGIRLIQEAANYVFELKAKLVKKMLLEELGNFLVSRNQQFLNFGWSVRIKDEQGNNKYREISGSDIEGDFICIADEMPPQNDMVRRNEAIQIYRQFQNDPDVNQFQLKKEILESFGKDTEKLMRGTDEVDIDTEMEVTAAEKDAEMEDELMFQGKLVTVADTDDHKIHIIVHDEELTQAPQEVYGNIYNHIEDHKAFLSPRLQGPVRGGMSGEEQNTGGLPEGPGGAEGEGIPAGIEEIAGGPEVNA